MSYSRSYRGTVSARYSETVTVDYPASQSGGSKSVSVSGSVDVPVDINIYVDTDKFDNNVDGCRRSVLGLNSAVVATTAAEIAAKREASTKIGRAVVRGFFNYITSELSQLKSELSTKCDSILATLFEQKGACEGKREQMAVDYSRITTRYTKLFTDLDNELNNRIREIDRPIFQVNREILGCTSRVTDTSLLGISTISAAETAQVEAILSASLIKNRAMDAIQETEHFLFGTYRLQKSINDMLLEGNAPGFYALPVVYIESKGESQSVMRKTYGTSASPLKGHKKLDVELSSRFQKSSLKWVKADPRHREQIDSYFNNELNSAQLDSRVAKVVMRLMNQNKFKVVKNS